VTSRFELMPFGRALDEAARLPEPARLTVTCSPKHGLDESLATAQRLRELGHDVTIHLAARMLRSREHLDELLAELTAAGVDDALVLGGDASPPLGPYDSAVALLPHLHEHSSRPRTLGIAGYPEGHPLVDDDALARALEAKLPYADYVTTQLCFDPEATVRFASGIPVPVLAGVPGRVDPAKLLEISVRVGVGPSLRYLRKQGGVRSVLKLAGGAAESLHADLVSREEIAGFHYFTFNRLLDTWSWVKSITPEEVTT
jgi:methylenetetrahydrofolate reductase (NADPH)